jgi:hypothetical protein
VLTLIHIIAPPGKIANDDATSLSGGSGNVRTARFAPDFRAASPQNGWHMSNVSNEFELLLGHAAFKLWPKLPRDVQETLFETAVPDNPLLRYSFAVFLHDHHPRTAHPPRPTNLG